MSLPLPEKDTPKDKEQVSLPTPIMQASGNIWVPKGTSGVWFLQKRGMLSSRGPPRWLPGVGRCGRCDSGFPEIRWQSFLRLLAAQSYRGHCFHQGPPQGPDMPRTFSAPSAQDRRHLPHGGNYAVEFVQLTGGRICSCLLLETSWCFRLSEGPLYGEEACSLCELAVQSWGGGFPPQ